MTHGEFLKRNILQHGEKVQSFCSGIFNTASLTAAALEVDKMMLRGQLGEKPNALEKLALEALLAHCGYEGVSHFIQQYQIFCNQPDGS